MLPRARKSLIRLMMQAIPRAFLGLREAYPLQHGFLSGGGRGESDGDGRGEENTHAGPI